MITPVQFIIWFRLNRKKFFWKEKRRASERTSGNFSQIFKKTSLNEKNLRARFGKRLFEHMSRQ